LAIAGLRLDPGDVHAYRLESGLALTADGAEAEIASPPIETGPGFAGEVSAWARLGRETLNHALPAGYSLRGYSTHLSVALPGAVNAEFAERYARSYGFAFGLLLDRRESLGIYVRPRPGRIELCGEFADGKRLEAAVAYAVGTVRAAAAGEWCGEVAMELLPCRERFGYRVHREATGQDAYESGRTGFVYRAGGRSRVTEVLAQCFGAATGHLNDEDAFPLREILTGERPLGVEAGEEAMVAGPMPAASLAGLAVRSWDGGGVRIEPLLATWEFAVYGARTSAKSAIVVVPASRVGDFWAALPDGGAEALAAEVSRATGALERHSQTGEPGVFAAVTPEASRLLAPEIALPGEPEREKRTSGKESRQRVGKMVGLRPPRARAVEQVSPVTTLPPPIPEAITSGGRPHWPIAVVVAALLVGAVAAWAIVASGGDGDDPKPTPSSATATLSAGEPGSSPAATEMPTPVSTPRPTEQATARPATATLSPAPTQVASTSTPDGGTGTATPPPTPDGGSATALPSATASPTLTTPTPTPTVPTSDSLSTPVS